MIVIGKKILSNLITIQINYSIPTLLKSEQDELYSKLIMPVNNAKNTEATVTKNGGIFLMSQYEGGYFFKFMKR